MEKKDSYEKLSKTRLWFVKTRQPCIELCKYVYDLAVELGVHVAVISSASKKEIQNNVFEMIRNKCINMASDELERNWLEHEMAEYYTHGQFWHPEEMKYCGLMLLDEDGNGNEYSIEELLDYALKWCKKEDRISFLNDIIRDVKHYRDTLE